MTKEDAGYNTWKISENLVNRQVTPFLGSPERDKEIKFWKY